MRDFYVAYNRRSGIPWAGSFDHDALLDFADKNDLVVLEVMFIPEVVDVES